MGRSPTNSKQKLIDTANALIWKSSYGSVSVDDICEESGIKKGSFYYYFASKAELAIAAMEDSFQTSEPKLIEVFSPTTPIIERFKGVAAVIYDKQAEAFEKYGRVCGCPFVSLGSEMAGNEELIRQKIEEILEKKKNLFIPSIEELIASGQLPATTNIAAKTAELHAFIMGQMTLARINNSLKYFKTDMESGLLNIVGLDVSPE